MHDAKSSALIDTYAQFPFEIVSGVGSRVRLRDGREMWDFYGGHAVCGIGHSHAAVADAIVRQARELAFYSNVVPLEIRTRAAERLVAFAGAGLRHVFFCNSGAEANENALKLAIQQTNREKIAVADGGWHGRTLLALSATTEEKLRKPFAKLLTESVRLKLNDLDDIRRIDDRVAAVIVEPIESIAGIVTLDPAFLAALRRRCDEIGALLVFDEIQTGVGRCGRAYIAGEHGTQPDIVTSAKSLANGFPVGAVLMNSRVGSRVAGGDLGSTFGGGPLACAAMLAVLDVIEREELIARAAQLGDRMRAALRIGPVCDVLGRGCLIGLRTTRPAKQIQAELFDLGFVTGTSADSHVLRLMPPMNLPFEAIDELGRALHWIGAGKEAAI
ncbi:MAG: aminotransferase class III-fold pyridoxal phosphate-dependent enzyme [Phycisphaerales bacterium]|nr:aminotransferase class III-fold pyridoxal phosphate-dependent enzyme [Phycisphaerales bacterium]